MLVDYWCLCLENLNFESKRSNFYIMTYGYHTVKGSNESLRFGVTYPHYFDLGTILILHIFYENWSKKKGLSDASISKTQALNSKLQTAVVNRASPISKLVLTFLNLSVLQPI